MTTYILRRLVALVPVLLLVSVVAFALVHFTPGDPVALILGEEATPEDIERVRHQLGLDRPLPEQYVVWLGRAVRGDLGRSVFVDQPVTGMIVERAEPTVMLASVALVITLLVGIPAGVWAAIRHRTPVDQSLMVAALLGVSMPSFWFGLNLILLFSVFLGWFPVVATRPYTRVSGARCSRSCCQPWRSG